MTPYDLLRFVLIPIPLLLVTSVVLETLRFPTTIYHGDPDTIRCSIQFLSIYLQHFPIPAFPYVDNLRSITRFVICYYGDIVLPFIVRY